MEQREGVLPSEENQPTKGAVTSTRIIEQQFNKYQYKAIRGRQLPERLKIILSQENDIIWQLQKEKDNRRRQHMVKIIMIGGGEFYEKNRHFVSESDYQAIVEKILQIDMMITRFHVQKDA